VGDGIGDVAADGAVADGRRALWARYDAGDLSAEELDARLRALDRAGDDPGAVARAVDGPVRTSRRGRGRAVAIGATAAALLVVVVTAAASDPGDEGRGAAPGIDSPPVPGGVEPAPVDPGVEVDCPELDAALERFEALDEETAPANPALLSDPVALPDGYVLGDEESIIPGSDVDVAMSVSAGNPLPVDILARTLNGRLAVTMRAWEYESAEAAGEAGLSVLRQGVCTYDMTSFAVPDRPEIGGSVVSGVIPTTAFASWRLGERRFTVAVQAGADGDPEATAAAQDLAGRIAALEYDAAATAPEPR
jgi:hypothetical protein